MKNKLLIALVIMAPMALRAATQCVALDADNITCTYDETGYVNNSPEWTATCTINSKTIKISGLGVCSDTSSGAFAAVRASLSFAGVANYCHCKMTLPVVSFWVQVWYNGENGVCSYDCARPCLYDLQNSSAFRRVLFSNLQTD